MSREKKCTTVQQRERRGQRSKKGDTPVDWIKTKRLRERRNAGRREIKTDGWRDEQVWRTNTQPRDRQRAKKS